MLLNFSDSAQLSTDINFTAHLNDTLYTVSTTQTNFLIYSEAADADLYIRKRFQICKILPYI